MAEQYFTADPTCESKQVPCSFVYRGHGLNFMTDAGVFSKGELDTGTRLLLDALPDVYGDVLDLGCGWGAIGVAVKKKYPQIEVVGTVGPFHFPSSDYIEGWKIARENKRWIDAVDEHYYEQPGWFLNHQDYYDH